MRLTFLVAISMLALVACSKTESKGGGGGGGGGAAVTEKLNKLKADLAAAKTTEEVEKVSEDCLGLQLESAMNGKDLKKDSPEYQAVCDVEYAKTLANLVIKNSTPEKMDPKCMSASMKLDDLVERHIQEADMKALSEQLNKACGM